MAAAHETEQSQYQVIKRLSDNAYLVRRKSDNAQFLGHPWDIAQTNPELYALMERGGKDGVAALLNHDNLINLVGHVSDATFTGWGGERRHLLLWDFGDNGSLDHLFKEPPVRPTVDAHGIITGFLPESLCWHVVTSMLRALAWLHEGYRDTYELKGDAWEIIKTVHDDDWMPILHRDIRAENIFLQTPRGIETYGGCKLGNFTKCFVSGHVNGVSCGPVVTVKEGDVTMDEMRKTMAVNNLYDVEKAARPYTKGMELFGVGSVLFRMMTSRILPDPEECNLTANTYCDCRHWDSTTPICPHPGCHPDIDLGGTTDALTEYSKGLIHVLYELLLYHCGSGKSGKTAVFLLEEARELYYDWKENTADGQLYRDALDDMGLRYQNWVRKDQENMQEALAQTAVAADGRIPVTF